MDRRAFIGTLAGGLLAAPLAAEAQPAGKLWRIGVFLFGPKTADIVGPAPPNAYAAALVRGLRELGYVYGQHFVTEARTAEGKPERLPSLVAEIINLQVDVIVAVAASLAAVKQATSTIPVVMPGINDPVGQAYAKSLARPGGNFTGLSFQLVELIGKRLELLKQLVPTPAPVAVLWQRAYPPSWEAAQAAARERRWRLLSLPIRDIDDIEEAFSAATKARAGAMLVVASAPDGQSRRVTDLAAKNRLPAMYHFRYHVEAGGLVSYAPDLLEIWRGSAVYVDKILKGAKPAEIPIEQPTKFDLVINLKTAKALGLTIPPAFMHQVDQVIE